VKLGRKSFSDTEIEARVRNNYNRVNGYITDSEHSDCKNFSSDEIYEQNYTNKFISEPKDERLISESENILHYFCLEENPDYCQKCKELKQIFKNAHHFLYNLPIHHFVKNFEPPSTMTLLNVILDEPQNKKISDSLEENVHTRKFAYDLRERHANYIIKQTKMYPSWGHIFFSMFKTKYLERDLTFFIKNNIISYESDFVHDINEEKDGVIFVNKNDYFENAFLFDGLLNEVLLEKEE
jgi:hypothetical protein